MKSTALTPNRLSTLILDNIDDALVLTDEKGTIQYLNQSARQLIQNREQIIGRNLTEFILYNQFDIEFDDL